MVKCAEAAQLTYSCRVYALFLERCHLIRRATDLSVVVLLWGKRPSPAPCCSCCCCNYSAVWGIFGLTFCIPFASQRDWNKSKHYGLPCGKLIALDVYVLVFTKLDCTAWSIPGCIWHSVVLKSIFMCFVFSCVQSCRKYSGYIRIMPRVAAELNVCLFNGVSTCKHSIYINSTVLGRLYVGNVLGYRLAVTQVKCSNITLFIN